MTTCLDLATCPESDRLYNIVCNFSYNYKNYICNSLTSCTRTDGTTDCCASNIADCITVASSLRTPTTQPTTTNSVILCNQLCNAEYRIDTCYWYEDTNFNVFCNENNDNYCCSQHREDCCRTNKTEVYIVFGSIAGILMLIALYWYVFRYHIKIMPLNNDNIVNTPEKYQIAIT